MMEREIYHYAVNKIGEAIGNGEGDYFTDDEYFDPEEGMIRIPVWRYNFERGDFVAMEFEYKSGEEFDRDDFESELEAFIEDIERMMED